MREIVAAVLVGAMGMCALPALGQDAGPGPGRPGPGGAGIGAGGAAPVPGLVGKLRERGARVTALGERGGLSGWFVEPGRGDAYTLYVAEDGHAVAGLLYGPEGQMVTRLPHGTAGSANGAGADRRASAAIGESSGRVGAAGQVPRDREKSGRFTVVHGSAAVRGRAVPAGLFAKSAALFGFTLGHRGRSVLLFADPECRWSREAVEKLGREAAAGRFRLRVIPVGLLGAKSARAAVRIVSSPDPALAWFGREMAGEHRAGALWVEESNAVFDRWGENAVPLIAWPDRGGAYVYAVGSIADVTMWADEVFGP